MLAVLAPTVAVSVDTHTSLTSSRLFLLIGISLGGRMICLSICSRSSSSCLIVCVPRIEQPKIKNKNKIDSDAN